MSLKEFLKDGDLTEFLKGDVFLSPSSSRSSSTSSSASASRPASRSPSPDREKGKEISEFMEEVKKDLEYLKYDTKEKIMEFGNEQVDSFQQSIEPLKTKAHETLNSYKEKIIEDIVSYFRAETEEDIRKQYETWEKSGNRLDTDMMPGFYVDSVKDTPVLNPQYSIRIQFYKPYYTENRLRRIDHFIVLKGNHLEFSLDYFKLMAEMIIVYHLNFHNNTLLKKYGIIHFETWLQQIDPYGFIEPQSEILTTIEGNLKYNVTAKVSKFMEFHEERKQHKTLTINQINEIFPANQINQKENAGFLANFRLWK